MRGGVTAHDLFYTYSQDDYEILLNIINENVKNTVETKMPLL